MDYDLQCNLNKCTNRLENYAWVTSCSHIFCDEDGNREFSKGFSCPACGTSLTNRCDIVRVDLNPSDEYKSIILAGLKPETIMEISSRALSFWSYQVFQARSYQQHVAARAQQKLVEIDQYYKQQTAVLNGEMQAMQKELDDWKTRAHSSGEKLEDKNRQLNKIQNMYEALRRKYLTIKSPGSDNSVLRQHPPNPNNNTMYALPPQSNMGRPQTARGQADMLDPFMGPGGMPDTSRPGTSMQFPMAPSRPSHMPSPTPTPDGFRHPPSSRNSPHASYTSPMHTVASTRTVTRPKTPGTAGKYPSMREMLALRRQQPQFSPPKSA